MSAFRNHTRTILDLAPGINLLVGQNAQGKTNILEAAWLLSSGRLLRGTRDIHAIQHGETESTVHGELRPAGSSIAVHLKEGVRKRAYLNSMSLPRASDLLGRLPTVCFTAEDLAIVRGEPSCRRTFMDTELCQLHIGYLDHVGQYKRCLEQRNALLRDAQESWVPAEVFEPWEQQMAVHGCEIRRYRRRWVGELANSAAEAHSELAAGEPLVVRYCLQDGHKEPEALREALGHGRANDVRRGSTSLGPHRDDLALEVAGREARSFGSQGQQRTAVIALKLAVQRVAQEYLGYPPVLLLDDVFSDLDAGRRANLVERALQEGGQVFLTCTEAGQAGEGIADRAKVFRVQSGRAEEV